MKINHLTFNNTYSINRGRARNSKHSGYSAPVRLGDFFIPDLIFGGVENTTPFLKEIISDFYVSLSSPRNLNGFEETSRKGNIDMTNIIPFNFKNTTIRTTTIDNNPWFVLTDCMNGLNIKNKSTKIRLDEKGVCKTYTLTKGGQQEVIFINEPNLYRLIFRSNKPQAQAFADWVYNEVLPSIRKNGSYIANQEELENWKEIVSKILLVRCNYLVQEEKSKILTQISNLLGVKE